MGGGGGGGGGGRSNATSSILFERREGQKCVHAGGAIVSFFLAFLKFVGIEIVFVVYREEIV